MGSGDQIDPVLGTITLNRRGVKDSLSHGNWADLKLPDFMRFLLCWEKGKTIDYQEDWKSRHYDTVVLVAPITISGGNFAGDYDIGATVMRRHDMQRFSSSRC